MVVSEDRGFLLFMDGADMAGSEIGDSFFCGIPTIWGRLA